MIDGGVAQIMIVFVQSVAPNVPAVGARHSLSMGQFTFSNFPVYPIAGLLFVAVPGRVNGKTSRFSLIERDGFVTLAVSSPTATFALVAFTVNRS
jgi:hypothetical protein